MVSAARDAGRAPTNVVAPEVHDWRQVGLNVFRILREVAVRARWQLAWLIYQLLEGFATVIILSIVWNSEYCSELYVKPWIILYSGRLIFRIPLSLYFIVARMRQRNIPSWINIFDSLLLVYLIFIWFWGNLWFYQSTTCALTAPVSYFYGVTLISLVYVWFFIPLLIFLGACFCYPLLRITLRACGIGEAGATKRMIAKLPHRKFDGHPIARPDGTVDESGTQCAICMSDFQVGEEIITLPCGHSFNKDCIERWLKVKRICALCRHDITQPGNV